MGPRKRSFDSSDDDEEENEESLSFKRKIIIEESDDEVDEDASKDDTYESDSSDDSEDDEDETDEQAKENDLCPICLGEFEDQMIGIPENCKHLFCADCIQEWTKNVNNCPIDRKKINLISVHSSKEGPVVKQIPVEDTSPHNNVFEDPPTYCQVCGQCDREESLLLCDGCDNGYHMECMRPRLTSIPDDEWYCVECIPNTNQPSSSRSRRADYTEDIPSTSDRAGTSSDAAARDLMYGQLSRGRARTVSTARNARQVSSRSTSTSRRTSSASASSTTKKKKKNSGKSRRKKSKGRKKGSRSKKAKRKIIENELEKFRKKLGKGSVKTENDGNVETTKGVYIYGHQFDLDEFFDDDQDFKYDDEKIDNTPRSTICDTPDVIGNILGGFDTLNPNNVTVLRDGTIKPKETLAEDGKDKNPESSTDTNHSACSSTESSNKRKLSESDSASKELTEKNKKRRKIRFLDEGDDDDEDFHDSGTKKKISDKLKKGYLEALKKKQKAKELQDEIDKMKSETVGQTTINHQASIFSVASFKIPKKPKSHEENDNSISSATPQSSSASPKKLVSTDAFSPKRQVPSASMVVSTSPLKTTGNKTSSCLWKPRPSAKHNSSAPKKVNKISNVIAKAKQAMSNVGITGKTKNDKIESFSKQTQRLSSIVDERRKSFPERKKKVLTFEEKVSLYQAGKLKHKQEVSRKRRHSDPSQQSNLITHKDKVDVKPLKSIIRVRAQPSCSMKSPVQVSKEPLIKKPISLKDYKERKLIEELFGDAEVEKKDEKCHNKKSVKFMTDKPTGNVTESEEILPITMRSSAMNDAPFAIKPDLNKTTTKLKDTLPFVPRSKSFSLPNSSDLITTSPKYSTKLPTSNTHQQIHKRQDAPTFPKVTSALSSPTSSNPFGELLAKNNKLNWIKKHSDAPLSIPIGVVSPQQRVDPPPTLNEDKKPTNPKIKVKNDSVIVKEEYITRVKELMKPFYKKGKVNKEQWKVIVKEAVMTIKKNPGSYTTDEEVSKLLKHLVTNTVEVGCTASG